MIRLTIYVLVIIAVIAATVFFTLNPGRMEVEFLGSSYSTPFVVALGGMIVLTFLMLALWRGILAVVVAPDQIRRFRNRRRKEQGFDALERALIASAAGDGETAVRQAARADAMLDRPALSRLLAARAAEAAGNLAGAEAHYEALLEDPRTRLVARRGLAQLADERGDHGLTAEHAADAFKASRTARWAFDALFDAQIAQSNWEGAMETLAEGEGRKHIPPDRAKRRRAVLLTAAAGRHVGDDDGRALDMAETAAKAAPGFAPAAVLAARLMAARRRHKRAAEVLEASWLAAPHPAVARAYRDLRRTDTRPKRAERLKGLAAVQPEHRESKLILLECALDEEEAETARGLLDPMLAGGAPSARLCAFASRLARLEGDDDAARRWMTRASHAPAEADWSDIDPDGEAFAYADDDWKRMVFVYGDEDRLIHPRYERFESVAGAVPETALLDAPRRRAAAQPVESVAVRQPDDPGVPGDEETARS